MLNSFRKWKALKKQQKELLNWKKAGKPAPPPHLVKQQALRQYADNFGLKILVETGTYYGDMVEAMKGEFDQIYSIELSEALQEKAKQRFRDEKTIEVLQGDSGIELGNLVPQLDRPTLFWLDGHYSAGVTAQGEKDTPIFEELIHIFNSSIKGHVIIVDDARCFGTDPAYPSVEELSEFVLARKPGSKIEVENDSIRITSLDESA